MQAGRDTLGRYFAIFVGRITQTVDHTGLIVVAEENAVPGHFIQTLLPLGKVLLERHERHLSGGPFELRVSVETYMLELEDHVELGAFAVGVFFGLFERDARRLADGHNVKFGENFLVHLLQVLVDVRPVGRASAVTVELVHERRVGQAGRLGDQADDVHTEAVDSLLAPAGHHIENFLSDSGIVPVEVGLFGREQMQVVHIRRLIVLPRGTGEPGAPVVGLFAVPAFSPEVIISLGVVLAAAALQEPLMLVGRVVDNEVHHDLDPAGMRLTQHPVKILHGAELIHDRLIIADVIAVVIVGRFIDGGEPDDVNTEQL